MQNIRINMHMLNEVNEANLDCDSEVELLVFETEYPCNLILNRKCKTNTENKHKHKG
jgi:hypothetical protein